jgi:hypothetical protein
MLPALCHIVSNQNKDEYLEQLLANYTFISCSNEEVVDIPNIIYGFKLATSTMIIDINHPKIDDNTFWVHSKGEIGFDEGLIDNLISDIHHKSNDLKCEAIELVLGEWDVDEFLMKLNGPPIIHDGNYEIYIVNSSDGKIYSFQKDEMRYCKIHPRQFLDNLYEKLSFNFYAFSSDEIDNKYILNNINPIYIQDLILSTYIKYIDENIILNNYYLKERLEKKYYLYIIYKILQLILKVNKKAPKKSQILSHYRRSLDTIRAETILSSSQIPFSKGIENTSKLIFGCLGENNTLTISHKARHTTTSRIFAEANQPLNPITLSDSNISDHIRPPHDSQSISCVDYKAFEFTILQNILNIQLPTDLHRVVARDLNITVSQAKKLNASIVYGNNKQSMLNTLRRLSGSQIQSYIAIMGEFLKESIRLKELLEVELMKTGYVVNTFGRRIKPKKRSAVLNNYVQSIGAEIMIDVINALFDEKIHILFQRFDSIFFIGDELTQEKVIDIMESIQKGHIYNVSKKIANNLTELITGD